MVGGTRLQNRARDEFCWADAGSDEELDDLRRAHDDMRPSSLNVAAPEFIPTLTATCPLVAVVVEHDSHRIVEEVQMEFRRCNMAPQTFVRSFKTPQSATRACCVDEVWTGQDGSMGRYHHQNIDKVLPEASEDEWLRRIESRRRAILLAKDTREYRRYIGSKMHDERDVDDPTTPDPLNRATSKRNWKYQVQQWRAALSKLYREEGQESSVSTDDWRSASDSVSTVATDDFY